VAAGCLPRPAGGRRRDGAGHRCLEPEGRARRRFRLGGKGPRSKFLAQRRGTQRGGPQHVTDTAEGFLRGTSPGIAQKRPHLTDGAVERAAVLGGVLPQPRAGAPLAADQGRLRLSQAGGGGEQTGDRQGAFAGEVVDRPEVHGWPAQGRHRRRLFALS
jgi:hypothetical protein